MNTHIINSDDVIEYISNLTPAAYVALLARTTDSVLNNSSNKPGIDNEGCVKIETIKRIISL